MALSYLFITLLIFLLVDALYKNNDMEHVSLNINKFSNGNAEENMIDLNNSAEPSNNQDDPGNLMEIIIYLSKNTNCLS